MIKKLFTLMLLFFLKIALASTSGSAIEGLNKELNDYYTYTKRIPELERQLNDYRLRISEIVTDLATDDKYNRSISKKKNELEKIITEVETLQLEAETKLEKLEDLIVITEESRRSAREVEKDKKKARNFSILKRRFVRVEKKVKAHIKEMSNFLLESKKWKTYLLKNFQRSIDKKLLKWEPSLLIHSPLAAIKDFFKSTLPEIGKQTFVLPKDKMGEVDKKIFLPYLLKTILFFILVGLFSKAKSFYTRNGDSSDVTQFGILSLIEERKLMVSLFTVFLLPNFMTLHEGFQIFHASLWPVWTIILCLTWLRIGRPCTALILNEINKVDVSHTIKFRSLPIVLYIIVTSLVRYLSLSSPVFDFLSSLLLGIISYKLLLTSARITIEETKNNKSDTKIFLVSMKLFVIFFFVSLLVSSLVSIIGFHSLSKTIQLIIADNLTVIIMGWLLYHVMSILLEKIKERFIQKKYFSEIFNFLKGSLNPLFFIGLALFILNSWLKSVLVFTNIWDLTILSVGDYNLLLKQPIYLVFGYYVFRFLYLCLIASYDAFLLRYLKIDLRNRANLISISKYFFILIYISYALAALGFTYKNVLIFASALGVGIGFGLQNIVNNFLSGIILLFEQPIRVGDIIEVDSILSKVKHIGIRSTIVETYDNSNIIIPNSDILSNKLINWTLNDNIIALKCEVGVAYGTDTDIVNDILLSVASQVDEVLQFPKPVAWFEEFADSSLNFTLKFFITRPEDKYTIKSSVMHLIDKKFKESNITIPFPQRDVHVIQN